MNEVVVTRKANWISRVGHSTLLAMVDTTIFDKKFITIPQFMRETNIDISYISISQGFSELNQMGLVTRCDIRRHYEDSVRSRAFSGVKAALSKKDHKELCKLLSYLYKTYSVERVAALATVAYLKHHVSYKTGKVWFSGKDYLDCLRLPIKSRAIPRSFRDAKDFITVDDVTGLFCINDHEPEVLNTLTAIDNLIENNKPWNKTK